MATRGRPSDPPKLRLLKQDPGRKAKPARKAAPRKTAKIPPGLSEEEVEEFKRMALEYPHCTDGNIFAQMAQITIDIRRMAEAIKNHGMLLPSFDLNPLVARQYQNREQIRKYLALLSGLAEKTVEVPDLEDDIPAIG